jgi:hypothetical protein
MFFNMLPSGINFLYGYLSNLLPFSNPCPLACQSKTIQKDGIVTQFARPACFRGSQALIANLREHQQGTKSSAMKGWCYCGDVSHYLNNRINQRVAFACGDDFASSYGIADA